jgi:3-hydroxymyristoyl/3-hydroxydecanoyl-(acyl carrier protein) dehydratase
VRKTKDAPKSIVDLGLPHRPPFVFVRELIACDPGVSAECATTFDGDDPMFAGHFPSNPLVPGVILTEALAQTAGIAAAAPHAEKCRTTHFALRDSRDEIFSRRPPPKNGLFYARKKLVRWASSSSSRSQQMSMENASPKANWF